MFVYIVGTLNIGRVLICFYYHHHHSIEPPPTWSQHNLLASDPRGRPLLLMPEVEENISGSGSQGAAL